MSTRSVTVELPGTPLDSAWRRRLREALELAVSDLWGRLGLVSTPEIGLADAGSRLAGVRVDGRPLPLSGRRRHSIAAALTGSARRPSEPADAEAFLRGRFDGAGEADRDTLIVTLVEAALLASIDTLVAADAELLARSWVSAAVSVRDGARLLRLAGRLGLAPAQLAPATLEHVLAEGDEDPYHACDQLVGEGSLGLTPILELGRATLRRLTTGERPLRPELIARSGPEPSSPRGIRGVALNAYGLTLPDIGLAVADDIPDDCFRVRFGPVRTPPQLVLEDGCVAVESVRGFALDAEVKAAHLDPVYGDWWRVIEGAGDDPPTWHARFYDPAALVVRGVYAELQPRLSWWAPRSVPELAWRGLMTGELYERMEDRVAPVIRWLLAGGAPLQHAAPLLEGMIDSLAEGDRSVAGMVRRARERLRAGVAGPIVIASTVEVVDLADDAVATAVASVSPEPLLDAHPELAAATGSVVAVCDASTRPEVADLLAGLRDAVRVASADEMRGAALEMQASVLEPVDG